MRLPSLRAAAGVALTRLSASAAIIAHLTGCSGGHSPAEIRFDIARDDAASGALARRVQFYVHDIELLDEDGTSHPFRLLDAAPWQSGRVALVDLASDAGTNRHSVVRGKAGSGTSYTGLRFTVGVPFELNHANPLGAAAPLDRSDLFWTWQTGYKFLRADVAVDGREWSFHLGSTGCSSASALRPPAAPCAQPNLMRVRLEGDPLREIVRLDLTALAAAARAAGFVACTGNYAHDPACAAGYAATALRPESGECAEESCAGQRLWSLD